MKIIRNRGSWYGKINGKDQDLPIGHSTCVDWANKRYVDRGCREPKGTPVNPRWLRWIDAVRAAGCMIIQETKVGPDKGADDYPVYRCVGYIGVFFVDSVQLDDDHVFSCDIVGRQTSR